MKTKEEFESSTQMAAHKIERAREEMGKVIIGQKVLIDRLLMALFAGGHVLLEGVPGLAKTLAVTTLAKVVDVDFKRIQFTPDLLPSDLTGSSIYSSKDEVFRVEKGPIFTNILLGDEINRAPPKVQSALLEVMEERQVTISGQTFHVEEPFIVIATQNPIEHEGTYPLPEAQSDRFMMKVKVDYPSIEEEKEIAKRVVKVGKYPHVEKVLHKNDIIQMRSLVEKVYIDESITDYILKVVFATRDPNERLIELGASPRATLYLTIAAKALAFINGRTFVTPQDIKNVGFDVLRHRVRPSYEALASDHTAESLITKIFNLVPVP